MNDARINPSVRLPSDEQREHLMVRVAKLYYDLERTQSEIATELGLTRWQVGRLLIEAKELGVVRIEITPRAYRRTELEVRLQQQFGLRDAIVVPSGGTTDSALLMESVAQAAAKYLAGLNPKADLIGVSWGRTMSAVAKFLPNNWNPGVHVVLVNGSTNLRSTSTHTSAVAEDDDIRAAQSALWERLRIVAEPGGAAAFAALLAQKYVAGPHERVAVLLCGANTGAVQF